MEPQFNLCKIITVATPSRTSVFGQAPAPAQSHIACCLSVWVSLTRAARATGQTIYRLKESLYHDYMRQEIENPSIVVNFA